MNSAINVFLLTAMLLTAATPAFCDTAEDYFSSGLHLFINDHFDGAIADYDKAIDLKPDYAEAYLRRGSAKIGKGDLDGAIADYTKYIELTPPDSKRFFDRADGYNHRAFAKQTKGDLDGAIADYTKYLESYPEDSTAYSNRAYAKLSQGDWAGSIADYTKAIELQPDDALRYATRGVAKSGSGDYDGAIADYSKAIELKLNDPTVYRNRALAKKAKGDRDGAIIDYSKLIELKPDDAQAYFERGCLRYDTHDFTKALSDFRMITGMNFRIWLIRTRLGEAQAATKELKVYLSSRTSGNLDDWDSKIGLFLTGQLGEGEFLAAAAKKSDPKTESGQLCQAYFYAGSKRLFAGDKAAGAEYFKQSIATDRKGYDEYTSAAAELKYLEAQKENSRATKKELSKLKAADKAHAGERLPENQSSKDMASIVRRHLEGNKDYQDLSRTFDNNGVREGQGDDSWKTTAAGLAAGKRLEGMRRDATLAEVKTNGGSREFQYSLNGQVVAVPISVSSLDNKGYRENIADKVAQNIVNYWVGADLKAADNSEADARLPENESSKDMPAIVRRHLEGIKDYQDLSRMFENNGAREGKGDDSWKTTAAGLAAGKQLKAMRRDAALAEVKTNGRSRALQYSVDGQVVGVPISVHSLDSNAAYRENIAGDIAQNIVNYYPVGADLKAALAAFRGVGDSGTPVTTKPTEEQLIEAVLSGNAVAVRALLANGADANAKDKDGSAVLSLAAEHGEAPVVLALLAKGAAVEAAHDYSRMTALMYAAQYGHLEAVRALLDKGADVNAKSRDAWTALMFAVNSGYADVVALLLDKGSDVDARDTSGDTILMHAVDKDKTDIAVVNALLAKGADVNARENILGMTALMDAVFRGNADVVRVLIAKGVDVNAKRNDGDTALGFAESDMALGKAMGLDTHDQGRAEAAQLLRAAGAH